MRRSIAFPFASVALGLLSLSLADAADGRSYTAGRFALELDGISGATFLRSVSGGSATADVVEERDGSSPTLAKKHLSTLEYEDLAIRIDPGAASAVADWIRPMLLGKATRKSGAVIAADFDFKAMRRLEFRDALITEIGFPACDAAAKDPAYLSVRFSPESTVWKDGSGAKMDPPSAAKQKQWLTSNFRLRIGDLPCGRVNKIDSFTIKQGITKSSVGEQRLPQREPSKLEIPNLRLVIDGTDVKPRHDWHQSFVVDGKNADGAELEGALSLLAPDLATELLGLDLHHIGIFRLSELPDEGADSKDEIRRFVAELYVESMEIHVSVK